MEDYKSKRVHLLKGDSLGRLKELKDNSVDSIVTDPPYGLSKEPNMEEVLKHWLAGDDYKTNHKGFMGNSWDSFVPGPSIWKECLRVLKPGGHVLSFFGSRTYDMGVLALRLAGFEIRDQIMWVYGSGLPKSQNIGKNIDKSGGASKMHLKARQDFARELREKRKEANVSRKELKEWFPEYGYVTENWERLDKGFRVPSLKAYQKLVEKLGISEQWREMIRAEDLRLTVKKEGKDRRNDGTVYGLGHNGNSYEATTPEGKKWSGWGTSLKPAHEPIVLARKPVSGSTASNVLEHGTGALNIDASRVGETDASLGKFPTNVIIDDSHLVSKAFKESGLKGSPFRLFYCAKAGKKDKTENGLLENSHHTVKPNELMRYLVKLITPENGVCLDPFMGSGSTGKAAIQEGFDFIGIEIDAVYFDISKSRILLYQK